MLDYKVDITFTDKSMFSYRNTTITAHIGSVSICYKYELIDDMYNSYTVYDDINILRYLLKQASTMRLLSLLKSDSIIYKKEMGLIKIRLQHMDYDFTTFINLIINRINYFHKEVDYI